MVRDKAKFVKKLKYGDQYCEEHDIMKDKELRHRVTNVLIAPATCPKCMFAPGVAKISIRGR